jgi:transcriptional regulator with XRE-family HTH domain
MIEEDALLKRFGVRVRELRKRAGLSQEAFADHCELDRTYIGGIERGERNVSLRNIAVIAKGLGITVSELMKGLSTRND